MIRISVVAAARKRNSVPESLTMWRWYSGKVSAFWHWDGVTEIHFFRSIVACLHLQKKATSLDRQKNSINVPLQEAPDVMLHLIDTAATSGISADYVLFDCWFANPAQITALKSRKLDVIAMVKKSSRIKYEYEEEKLNIKQIYAKNKKRRGCSKYLLSVNVMVGKENPVPARIVCVRNKANRKDWLAILCTNTEFSLKPVNQPSIWLANAEVFLMTHWLHTPQSYLPDTCCWH